MDVITIDIKSNMQTVNEAIAQFLIEVESYKKGGYKVMKIIHGYGSHGVGGKIKDAFLKKCEQLKRQQKITEYACCSNLSTNSSIRKMAINYCPDLIADGEFNMLNPGCSIVIL